MILAQVSSEQVVLAYIERIKEVNPIINAVVEDRFEAAIEDARRADRMVESTSEFQLITNYPILGVPFTVKESCSLKGKYPFDVPFVTLIHKLYSHLTSAKQFSRSFMSITIVRIMRKRKYS